MMSPLPGWARLAIWGFVMPSRKPKCSLRRTGSVGTVSRTAVSRTPLASTRVASMTALSAAYPSGVQCIPNTASSPCTGQPGPPPLRRVARPVVAQAPRAVRIGQALLKRLAEAVERDRGQPQRREPGMGEGEVTAHVANEGRLLARRLPVVAELQVIHDRAEPGAGARRVDDLEHDVARRRVVAVAVQDETLDLVELERASRLRVHMNLKSISGARRRGRRRSARRGAESGSTCCC